ncbi:amino acid transporter-like protein [Usnea florida]
MENELADANTFPKISSTTNDPRKFAKDETVLARFGKRQQLRRDFGLLPVIGLTSTLMITWEAITATLLNGLQNGGPAGLIYGYIFVWCGASLQALVMGEMASMIPLAGGPFNWVAILSPPWCKNFLSYLAGWLTVITWQALVAGVAYIAGTLVQGLLILNYPSYDYQRWHGTLLFYAVLAFALFVNTYLGRHLPQIESMMLLFHILGFFGILIPLVYLAPHQPANEVFTNFLNKGDWSTTALSFFVGLISATNSFPGLDAADHIAEEIQNAPTVIPLSMGISTLLNGSLGFAMLLSLLFCMPSDIDSILNSETYYPFMGVYTYAVGSTSGATAMASVIVITQIFAAVGIVATASRMLWAFAREGGLPFSKFIARVDQRTHLPLYAIGVTTVINLLLALINIGSSVGFDAFISLIIAGYYSSFILSASVMLNKRLTTPDSDLPWGPFKLGRAGVPVTVVAIAYSFIGAFFSMWPTTVKPSGESMNYCVVVFGGVMLFSLFFYLVYGRRHYTVPTLEIRS